MAGRVFVLDVLRRDVLACSRFALRSWAHNEADYNADRRIVYRFVVAIHSPKPIRIEEKADSTVDFDLFALKGQRMVVN